jgi:hypothetical protein
LLKIEFNTVVLKQEKMEPGGSGTHDLSQHSCRSIYLSTYRL